MADLEIRATRLEDLDLLIADMRQTDLAELAVSTRQSLSQAVRTSCDISLNPQTIWIDGRLAGIFGVVCLSMSSPAVPWLLTTEVLAQAPAQVARKSVRLMRSMLKQYGHLRNYVDARNTQAIHWLTWLGFELSDPAPFGPYQQPFRMFEMRKE